MELHNMRTTWSRENDERGPPKQVMKSSLAKGITETRPQTADPARSWVDSDRRRTMARSASAA